MNGLSKSAAWSMVLLTILLTVYGQFVIKYQALRFGVFPDNGIDRIFFLGRLLLNLWVISTFIAALFASLTWIAAMTRLPLSHAYPVNALALTCIVFGGAWFFSDPMTTMRLLGVGFVVVGLVICGQG